MPSLGGAKEPISIPGSPPDPAVDHRGCRFVYRCPFAVEVCHSVVPELIAVEDGRKAACHRSAEMPGLRSKAEMYTTWMRADEPAEGAS